MKGEGGGRQASRQHDRVGRHELRCGSLDVLDLLNYHMWFCVPPLAAAPFPRHHRNNRWSKQSQSSLSHVEKACTQVYTFRYAKHS